MITRRKLVRLGGLAASVPVASTISLNVRAAEIPEKVPVNDPAAVALKYAEVATDVDRPDKMGVPGNEQICGNCRFYKNSDDPEWGGCALFQNRLVARDGWCLGWVPVA